MNKYNLMQGANGSLYTFVTELSEVIVSSSEHLGTFWSLAAIMYHFLPLSLMKFILRLIK